MRGARAPAAPCGCAAPDLPTVALDSAARCPQPLGQPARGTRYLSQNGVRARGLPTLPTAPTTAAGCNWDEEKRLRGVQLWETSQWCEHDARAAEEDETDEAPGAMEAVRAARDRPDLAIHALSRTVRQARGDVREDALEVRLDRAGDLLERLEPGPVCPIGPLEKLCPSDIDLPTIEYSGERLFEQVRTVKGPVASLYLRELLELGLRQVPGILL